MTLNLEYDSLGIIEKILSLKKNELEGKSFGDFGLDSIKIMYLLDDLNRAGIDMVYSDLIEMEDLLAFSIKLEGLIKN